MNFAKIHENLTPEHLNLIRQNSQKAEKDGRLPQEVLELIFKNKWLKIMEPKPCGGLEWPLPKIARLFEALAYADGNVGWCVNLGAGANLFAGYLKEQTAQTIFSKENTWCAGSGAVRGKAIRTESGFRLTGKWKYASGSAHATHFTANAYLYDEKGKPIKDEEKPLFRSFIFPVEKVTVHNSWQVTGLKATSSNDFQVKDLFVPKEHVFSLTLPSPFAKAPLFHFPFNELAIVNMAVMPLGMSLHFLTLFEELMANKIPLNGKNLLGKEKIVQDVYQKAKTQFLTHRNNFYNSLDNTWQIFEREKVIDENKLKILAKEAGTSASSAQQLLYDLFPFCGMSVLFETSKLNKVWRDLSAAGQHYLLSPMISGK